MTLLIVESPAKAKAIGKYLGKSFKVLASFGHVRSLSAKKDAVRPDENFSTTYVMVEKSSKNLELIIQAAKEATAIYLATDPDREGEAIAWHIVELLKERRVINNIPIHRVCFYEITKNAVTNAIKDPHPINMDLVESQRARQALDWLVGYNLSPLLWMKIPNGKPLSAGRVQSVALRLICERQEEIDKFKTEEYWSLSAECKKSETKELFKANLYKIQGNKVEKFSFRNMEEAEKARDSLQNLKYYVDNIEKKQVKRKASPPFTTSTMLQEAARKLRFSSKKTAQVAQKLYEGLEINGEIIGLITYMRTDSVTISKEAITNIGTLIIREFGERYLPDKPKIYKTKVKNAQEAHEAIRPTDFNLSPNQVAQFLDKDQLKLYELIWKRTIASQMNDGIIEVTAVSIKATSEDSIWRANGNVIIFDGFLRLYKEDQDEENDAEKITLLPKFTVNEKIDVDKIMNNQHFTQPPPCYTDASLIKKMEEVGIGRPSTYPTIISILQDRGYVRLEKRAFIPEFVGRVVSTFLTKYCTKYVEYSFTADMETELDDISNGQKDFLSLLNSFWQPFDSLVQTIKDYPRQEILSSIEHSLLYVIPEEEKQCPKCQEGIVSLKFGKFGCFIGCSRYPDCNYTKQISNAADNNQGEQQNMQEYPKILGNDPETGNVISIRKGPYGFYLQLDSDPVKRSSLGKTLNQDIDLAYAIKALSLPKILGHHPTTNQPITVGIGKFGPYIEHAKKYTSIKQYDPYSITLEQAIEEINKPKTQREE